MQRCHIALDTQVDMIRWWRSHSGLAVAKFLTKEIVTKEGVNMGQLAGKWTGEEFAEREARRLDRAETYWINAKMTDLTMDYMGSMGHETLLQTDLPHQNGFIYFDKAIALKDGYPLTFSSLNEGTHAVRAISWNPTTVVVGEGDVDGGPWAGHVAPGIALTMYTDYTNVIRWGKREGWRSPRLWIVDHFGWPFATDWQFDEGEYPDCVDSIHDTQTFIRGFLKAFWAICREPYLAETQHEGTDRHTRRRATRAGFLGKVDEIKVVTLRKIYNRATEGDGESGESRYSHQFRVRAHWRNQWYPSINSHRKKLIPSYIKGPEDAPFIEKDTIFKVTR